MTGKKTIAVVSVAASTGKATSRPPRSAATSGASPISLWRKMFSSTTTELSINRENASASPPRIIALTVLLPSARAMNAASAESGMDRKTATVARMLPRKIRIIRPVNTRPIRPSWIRLSMALRTNTDWSKTTLVTSCLGTSSKCATASLIPSTTAIVFASPLLQHRQIYRRLSVHPHHIVLDLRRVLRLPHVRHQHRRFPHRLERQRVDVLDIVDLAVGVQIVVQSPDLHVPRRQD